MSSNDVEWVSVFQSAREEDVREQSLVLRSADIDFHRLRHAGAWSILVSAADEARAREELSAYASENRDWAPVRVDVPQLSDGWVGVLCFAVVLLLTAVLTQRNALGVDWFDVGQTQAGLIRGGQVWRTVTALCLHVDLIHLLGNLLFGGAVGLFAGRLLGSGRAWFTILMAGAIGNFLNALLRPAEHTSIGASTAVFAGLGLLAAHGWRVRKATRMNRLERWVPLAGGFALLGLMGTGEGRTDIPAHAFGFCCGAGMGMIGWKPSVQHRLIASVQVWFGFASLFVIMASWSLAIAIQSYSD